jgi:hypothetical protein
MNKRVFASGTLVAGQTAWIGTLATSKSSRMISTLPSAIENWKAQVGRAGLDGTKLIAAAGGVEPS